MLLALLLAACLAGAPGADVHPMDGPDADVRIRIKPDEVRMVCAFNLAFVDAVVEVPRESPNELGGPELGAVRAALFAHLADVNEVVIDGVAVTPLDVGFTFLEAPAELVTLFPRFGARALAKVQLELSYPAKSPPGRVSFRWGPFPPNAVLASPAGTPPIEITAQLSAEGRDTLVTLTADAPEHVWTASGVDAGDLFLAVPAVSGAAARSLPLASLGLAVAALAVLAGGLRRGASAGARRGAALVCVALCAGAAAARDVLRVPLGGDGPALGAEDARAVFRPLHANIYRAFDYDEEAAIYAALERSVEGPLLEELYEQMYRSLIDQENEGARSSVQAVRLFAAEVLPPEGATRPGFDVDARWQVDGAVFHWGHAHHRTNEYRARYGVRATDAGWRITSSQVLEERRVSATPLDAPPAGAPAEPLLPEGFEDL